MKLKKNDQVLVISGKDRGKLGKVLRVNRRQDRLTVQGVSIIKKHVKASGQKPGGIISEEAPIHVSNLKLICPQCSKASRIGYRKANDGRKERICKQCGESVEQIAETTKK